MSNKAAHQVPINTPARPLLRSHVPNCRFWRCASALRVQFRVGRVCLQEQAAQAVQVEQQEQLRQQRTTRVALLQMLDGTRPLDDLPGAAHGARDPMAPAPLPPSPPASHPKPTRPPPLAPPPKYPSGSRLAWCGPRANAPPRGTAMGGGAPPSGLPAQLRRGRAGEREGAAQVDASAGKEGKAGHSSQAALPAAEPAPAAAQADGNKRSGGHEQGFVDGHSSRGSGASDALVGGSGRQRDARWA